MSSHVDDFNTRNKVLTAIRIAFSKCFQRHFDLVSKYNVGLKTLPLQGLSESEFYGDLVYKFRKIIGKYDFFIISRRQLFVIKNWLYHRCFATDCKLDY